MKNITSLLKTVSTAFIFLLSSAAFAQQGANDPTFNPNTGSGTGASSSVFASAILPDGKIIICGDFFVYNGVSRNRIARLNANGSLDVGFDPGTGAGSPGAPR